MTGLLLCLGSRADAVQGTYTGSYYHTEGIGTEDVMRHRYDAWTRTAVPGGLDLNLNMSLSHLSRPGLQDSDLLRSRFGADLTGSRWRARGEWTPWQDVSVASTSPRQRNLSLELSLNPRTLPGLGLFYQQFDTESATAGRATTRDYRVQAYRNLGVLRSHLQYRRLETRSAARFTAPGRRNEWQAGLSGTRNWGTVTGHGSYDGLILDARNGTVTEKLGSHRFSLGGTWRPAPKLTLSGDAVGRWGASTRNLTRSTIDERSLNARAGYRPLSGLDIQLAREYRRRRTGSLVYLSDFVRLSTTFQRRLRPRIGFQAGAVQTANLQTRRSTPPTSSAHALLDAEVIRGLTARGEIQVAGANGPRMSGIQWRPSVRVRALPSRVLRLEGTWTRSTLPKLDGVPQRERQWEFQVAYQPVPRADLSGTYRRLDASGRVEQHERYGTLSVSWRLGQRGRLSLDATRREAAAFFSRTSERVLGVEAAFGLPGDFRGRTSWRMNRREGLPRQTQIGVTLSKTF